MCTALWNHSLMPRQENLPNDSEGDSSHMESQEANVTHHPSQQLSKFPDNTTNPEKGFFVVGFFFF